MFLSFFLFLLVFFFSIVVFTIYVVSERKYSLFLFTRVEGGGGGLERAYRPKFFACASRGWLVFCPRSFSFRVVPCSAAAAAAESLKGTFIPRDFSIPLLLLLPLMLRSDGSLNLLNKKAPRVAAIFSFISKSSPIALNASFFVHDSKKKNRSRTRCLEQSCSSHRRNFQFHSLIGDFNVARFDKLEEYFS